MQDHSPSKNSGDKPRFDFTYFRPIGRIALIFFVGLSFYLFVSTLILLLLTKPDREVKVPDVVGKQFADVCNGLVRKGFRPEIRFQDVYDITGGTILSQYPEAGEIVYEGGAIKLQVSRVAHMSMFRTSPESSSRSPSTNSEICTAIIVRCRLRPALLHTYLPIKRAKISSWTKAPRPAKRSRPTVV